MAQNAPDCKDTQDFQFKLHDKFVAFKKCGEPRSNVKLLAISSSRGLLFAGNPTLPELKVIVLKDLVNAKSTDREPQARHVPLPSVPNYLSCSSDGNLLAVNHTQNGTSLLSIYAVPSFMGPGVRPVYSIRLAPEDYVHAVQLLWNPVLPNSLAVVLNNGALGMYALKEGGNFELHSLDKSHQVKCGCWSPRGKQIVLGFPSGKLQQFKPDLTPAKTIECPPNVHDAPFDTISIQWLSTYQFAVIFLQHGEDCNPSLYILNAPKAGPPSYINYYDICYSMNGPRNHQFLFNHVPQWNVLLVTSANGVEVGVMGTSEAGETPSWQQFNLLDEARIELPLNEKTKEETFPLGFVYDTSSTHQLSINDKKLQAMPMVHVLGSDGALLSFNFLNLLPGAVSVCSPPPPVADTSGQFRPLSTLVANEKNEEVEQQTVAGSPPPKDLPTAASSDISFAFTPNTVTSTPAPAKEKQASLFSGFGTTAANPPAASQLTFGAAPAAPLSFAAPTSTAAKPALGFGGLGGSTTTNSPMSSIFSSTGGSTFGGLSLTKPAAPTGPVNPPALEKNMPSAPVAAVRKPLYTVPPTFTPPAGKPVAVGTPLSAVKTEETFKVDDTEPIIRDMIALQIESFNQDIQKQKDQTKTLLSNISAPSALKSYAKRLDDLQELNEQAKDVEFEQDVQSLRQGLNEAYAIVAECRAKLEMYKNPDITRLMNSSSCDHAGRRMLLRLQSYVGANEAQLRLVQQNVDLQWEQLQDALRRNSKSRMHMPFLEGIYQRLTRLQNQTSDLRIVQNNIKTKLKERGLLQAALLDQEKSRSRTTEAVETLADSILSMSLRQVVDSNAAKLTQERLKKIRQVVQHQKIKIICPQRPDRVGIKSEVILETKTKQELIKKAAAKPSTANKAIQAAATAPVFAAPPAAMPTPTPVAAPAPGLPTVSTQLPKPMPSKPVAVEKAGIGLISGAPVSSTFSFSPSSPFAKTSAITNTTTSLSSGEAAKPGFPMFGGLSSGTSNFSFGGNDPKTPLSFGGPSSEGTAKSNLFQGVGKDQQVAPKPTPVLTKPSEPAGMVETKSTNDPLKGAPPSTPKSDTAGQTFGFPGFKAAGGTAGSAAGSAFSFGGLGSSLGFGGASSPATTSASAGPFSVLSTASTKPSVSESFLTTTSSNSSSSSSIVSVASKPAAPAAEASPKAPPVSSSSDPVGGLFASVNICKPNTKETSGESAKPANIFGTAGSSSGPNTFQFGGGAGETTTKNLFGSIASSAASGVTSSTTITATPTSTPSTASSLAIKSDSEAATKVDSTATVTSPFSTETPGTIAPKSQPAITASTTALSVATPAAPATVATAASTTGTSVPGSAFSFSNAFSSLGSAATVSTTNTSTTSNTSTSVFGGFGAAAGAATTTAMAPVVSSPFQSTTSSTASTGNIFGNIPKPETNLFGPSAGATAAAPTPAAANPPTGLFASAAISSASPFGSPPSGTTASGGNIFGQAIKASAFAQPTPAASGVGGSIFGGGTSSSFGSSSIFGGSNPQSSSSATGGTSIFGQNVFGQSAQAAAPATGGNIFSNAVTSPQQQPQPSAFGGGGASGGGSIFSSGAASPPTPASGGSIFGGGSTTGGFGSFSQSSPASGGFGSVFGGSGSVAQTGFGSPQTPQQQPTAGGFGAKPVFGGSPAFGASPTFGGAPTFGSPKGFGGFGGATTVTSPPAFGAPAKPTEGNIFETLGGQDSGLSFGNLAQTGNSNAQKPAFGGSSFMNYR
ncbi:nuclear pore complex protein Nup214 [Drosophila bipectinata]|uniref:nuclear pore complex protein Nup214 n=1 Tax=Drosophila bipectinata TaxID=42026 RepID=UPI001C896603|nr:nuclear pore complex protein Nup214 [Drosophila bipectinata]